MRWQLVIFWLGLGLVATAPVKWRRQVVAPTWLLGPTIPPSSQASRVVVTQQNLREVAALRAQIQKAVNEDTFVVAAPPSQVSFLKRILGF